MDRVNSATHSLATLTLWGRLRHARGVTMYFVMLALAPCLVALTVVQEKRELASPDIGVLLQRDPLGPAVVAEVDVRWSGVAPGDVVLAVDGQAVDGADDLLRFAETAGASVTLRFERERRIWEQRAQTQPRTARYRLAVMTRLMAGALLLLIALATFLVRPGAKVSWLFLVFCYLLGVLALTVSGLVYVLSDTLLYGVVNVAFAGVTTAGLHLFLVFPRRARLLNVLGERALYLPALPLVVGFNVSVALGSVLGALVVDLAGRAWSVVVGLIILAVVVGEWRRARRERELRLVMQYRWLFAAIGVGLLVPAVLTGLLQLVGANDGWLYELSSATLLVFALMCAYTLVRHNALEIDRYTASLMGYALTLAGVVTLFFAVVLIGVPLLVARFPVAESPEVLVGVTAAVVLVLGPAYRRLKRGVDRWFSREQASALETASLLSTLAATLKDSSRDEAFDAVLGALDALRADHAAMWLLDEHGQTFRRSAWDETPIRCDGALGTDLAVKGGGVAALCAVPLSEPAQEEMWVHHLAMASPIHARGVVAGFLGVGRKTSGAAYLAEEVALLTAVCAQAASVIERADDELRKFGRYRIERRLGVGGMAEVFLAWQVGPGGFERKVALKRPLPELASHPRCAAMFADEARIAAQLQHPNIAQVYDFDEQDGVFFLAMEYVDGPSLSLLIHALRQRGQPAPVGMAIGIAEGVLRALEHAHALCDDHGTCLGIVHRDVTPRNILLGRDGQPKLVDFGIARAASRLHNTETGGVKGTIPYMSPEQISGGEVDARSDVYTAAATLYELLTLERAYPNGPRPDPPPRHSLPASLHRTLCRAMAVVPGGRPVSAAVFREELLVAAKPATAPSLDELAVWAQGVAGWSGLQPAAPSRATAVTQPYPSPA